MSTPQVRALWALYNLVQLLAWHVIRLTGDDPKVRAEIEIAREIASEAISRAEGT